MDENKQCFLHIMLYYVKKGKNTSETWNKISAVYGEGAVTDWTCQKWFMKFCARNISLDNAPWLDRPDEINSDQIETLIENNQYYTTWERADIHKIFQINEVIGESEKYVFYFTEKNHMDFMVNLIFSLSWG